MFTPTATMVMEQRYDCNVVLVGDCKVGKTAIASRFVNTKFSEVRTTISHKSCVVKSNDDLSYSFSHWKRKGA